MWEESVTLFPPPPRIVRRKSESRNEILFTRLFLMPHMIVGIGMFLAIPAHLWVYYYGTPVTAQIDQVEFRKSTNKKSSDSYFIRYHYLLSGRSYEENESRDLSEGARTRVGDTFNGRATSFLVYTLFLPMPRSIRDDVNGFAMMVLVWDSIMAVFFYIIWVQPIRRRLIAKHGQSTVGVITARKVHGGRSTTYSVRYSYMTPDGEEISAKSEVSAAAYQQAFEGLPVTVLYHPAKPKRSIPYELGEFIVIDRAMG